MTGNLLPEGARAMKRFLSSRLVPEWSQPFLMQEERP